MISHPTRDHFGRSHQDDQDDQHPGQECLPGQEYFMSPLPFPNRARGAQPKARNLQGAEQYAASVRLQTAPAPPPNSGVTLLSTRLIAHDRYAL